MPILATKTSTAAIRGTWGDARNLREFAGGDTNLKILFFLND